MKSLIFLALLGVPAYFLFACLLGKFIHFANADEPDGSEDDKFSYLKDEARAERRQWDREDWDRPR